MILLYWRDFICYRNSRMFPNEFPWLPPKRDVDLTIELVLGKAAVSKTPYKVSTPEMLEIKMQLQELWEKKYNRPSVFPWGAPVGLRKRKNTHSNCVFIQEIDQGHYEEQVSFS